MEVWKEIKEFENYEISNLGNLRVFKKGVIEACKIHVTLFDYYVFTLNKNGRKKSFYIHQLVANTFLSHKIDGDNRLVKHRDLVKTNNSVENIEIVKEIKRIYNNSDKKSSSIYKGVCWNVRNGKWQVQITIKGSQLHLGCYKDEVEAAHTYDKKLIEIGLEPFNFN